MYRCCQDEMLHILNLLLHSDENKPHIAHQNHGKYRSGIWQLFLNIMIVLVIIEQKACGMFHAL